MKEKKKIYHAVDFWVSKKELAGLL